MKKDNNKFFLGVVLGAAVGVLAGILTAPKSGKETRQDLKEQGKKAFNETKKTGQKLYQDTKTSGQKLIDKFFNKKGETEDKDLGVVEEVSETIEDQINE